MTRVGGAEPVEHGGALTAACATYGGQPGEWLDLSTGINPVAPELPVIGSHVWRRLPDRQLVLEATAAAARRYQSACRPLAVAGVQAAIQMLPQLVEGPVAVIGPTYEEYRRCFEAGGLRVDLIGQLSDIAPQHRTVVVVNPNNPDGRCWQAATLLDVADSLSARQGHLIVDEAFADMRSDISLAQEAGRRSGLVVLRSFGKFFGLAGLRLGFVLAEEPLLSGLDRLLGPWAVSGPALAVASALLQDDSTVQAVRANIGERHQALQDVLTDAGLTVAGSTALFALVDDARAPAIHELLCRNRILTRRFNYEPRWLRFGLCPDRESDHRLAGVLSRLT